MRIKELRDYIEDHLEELEEQLENENSSITQYANYLQGCIETYQHILGKLHENIT